MYRVSETNSGSAGGAGASGAAPGTGTGAAMGCAGTGASDASAGAATISAIIERLVGGCNEV